MEDQEIVRQQYNLMTTYRWPHYMGYQAAPRGNDKIVIVCTYTRSVVHGRQIQNR